MTTICKIKINPRVSIAVEVAASIDTWEPRELQQLATILTWIARITALWQKRGEIDSALAADAPKVKK